MVGCPVVEEEVVVEGQEGVEVEEGEVQHHQVQAIFLLLIVGWLTEVNKKGQVQVVPVLSVQLLLVVGWQVVAQAEELEAGQEEVEVKEGEVQHQQVLLQRGLLRVDQLDQKGQEEGIEGALLKAV